MFKRLAESWVNLGIGELHAGDDAGLRRCGEPTTLDAQEDQGVSDHMVH